MVKCHLCGADTVLYTGGQPICLGCDEARQKEIERRHTARTRIHDDSSDASDSPNAEGSKLSG